MDTLSEVHVMHSQYCACLDCNCASVNDELDCSLEHAPAAQDQHTASQGTTVTLSGLLVLDYTLKLS